MQREKSYHNTKQQQHVQIIIYIQNNSTGKDQAKIKTSASIYSASILSILIVVKLLKLYADYSTQQQLVTHNCL